MHADVDGVVRREISAGKQVKKTYACVRVKQVDNAKELLLFSAPADDIGDWVGIPQRLSFGAAETAGFQQVGPKDPNRLL